MADPCRIKSTTHNSVVEEVYESGVDNSMGSVAGDPLRLPDLVLSNEGDVRRWLAAVHRELPEVADALRATRRHKGGIAVWYETIPGGQDLTAQQVTLLQRIAWRVAWQLAEVRP